MSYTRPYKARQGARPAARPAARQGFTLIEMLVVIGIVTLLIGFLLVAVNVARTKARAARIASDMQTIAVALEAYKQDFGDYPRLDYSPTAPVQGPPSLANLLSGPPSGYVANPAFISGGELLAWALIGPYDAHPATNPPTPAALVPWRPGDGKDGMGFRVGPSARGTVYGPYLDVETFLHNPAVDPSDQNPTFRYYYYLHDAFRQPILYYPRAVQGNGWLPWQDNTQAKNNPVNLYRFDDNGIAFVRSTGGNPVARFNAMLARFNPTGPYLLWSAGPDLQFSVDDPTNPTQVNSCDDVLFSGAQ